jgi:hypothetical protein
MRREPIMVASKRSVRRTCIGPDAGALTKVSPVWPWPHHCGANQLS